MDPAEHQITQLLQDWRRGDEAAPERLLPVVYSHLHRMAGNHMRGERGGHVLQTTALIHEAWMRLAGESGIDWQNRVHFFAVAAQTMRRILVDFARREKRAKRGGVHPHVELSEAAAVGEQDVDEVLALDEALTRLERVDARKVRVIELRFFGGMSVEEVAELLGVSSNTVIRDWSLARAWLRQELQAASARASYGDDG